MRCGVFLTNWRDCTLVNIPNYIVAHEIVMEVSVWGALWLTAAYLSIIRIFLPKSIDKF